MTPADSIPLPGSTEARRRCGWVPLDKPAYVAYHDEEWGVVERDSRALFAKLILDGMQAGLSWWSVLSRREGYDRAFDGLDPAVMAAYDDVKVAALLTDPGIIRNRQKVASAVANARAYVRFEEAGGSFSAFLWSFVDDAPVRNAWRTVEELPAATPASSAMSEGLRRLGFSFVGPTICYAFMQAVGMVNDHTVDCFRYADVAGPPARAYVTRNPLGSSKSAVETSGQSVFGSGHRRER